MTTHVLCIDATTCWIEEYDETLDGHPCSQVIERYDSEREALEGLAKARAQQSASGDEDLSYDDALSAERRELGLA